MRTLMLLLHLSLFLNLTVNGQLTKIDHFFIATENSKEVFDLFTSELNVPVVWDYKKFGNFSSGGITVGNIVLELTSSGNGEVFYGIAFEPSGSDTAIIKQLDQKNISHGPINTTRLKGSDGVPFPAWSTISLPDILPDKFAVFICDYKSRDYVARERNLAASKLNQSNGGRLGIKMVKQLEIGTQDYENYSRELSKLPGITVIKNKFSFTEGPPIVLEKAARSYFRVIIQVNSVSGAKSYLESIGQAVQEVPSGIQLDIDYFGAEMILSE